MASFRSAETLTIDGSSLAANITIDANHASRVLQYLPDKGDLTLDGLNLVNGHERFSGGAGILFLSGGMLAISGSVISDNTTVGPAANGGGIFTNFGRVTLVDSTIDGNHSGGQGGGIYARWGAVTLIDSTVSGE